MSRFFVLVVCVWMIAGAFAADSPAQIEQTKRQILFENQDFAVIPLSRLRGQRFEDRLFSGLIVSRGHSEASTLPREVWEVSSPRLGSERYYWAESARRNQLTAVGPSESGFLIVPKTTKPLSRKIFASDLPDVFRQSVGLDIQSIASLVAESESGKRPGQIQQDRARAGLEDLSFKSDWFSSNGANSARLSPLVDVVARTLGRTGVVVQHCTVWYVALAWADDKSHWMRFNQFSSPTSQSIPVGLYEMWANHDGRDGTKSKVGVGDDLEPRKHVDLDAP